MNIFKTSVLTFTFIVIAFTCAIAQQAPNFSYWIPYVDLEHRGRNVTGNYLDLYALEDSTIVSAGTINFTMDAGDIRGLQPPDLKEGLNITSNKPLQIKLLFHIAHFGLYEDGELSYSIIEESQLGTEYWIPTPNTVISILATTNNTSINVAGTIHRLNSGQTKHISSVKAGTRILSDKPIAVVVVNFTSDHYGSTYAYELYPVNELGTTYFSPHQHAFSYQSATDATRVYVLAVSNKTVVTINNTTVELQEGQSLTFPSNEEISISSSKPVYAIYLSDVNARDPWGGVFRHYNYALSLLPSNLGITDAIFRASGARGGHGFPAIELGIVSFENDNRIALLSDGIVRRTETLNRGETIYYHEGEIPEWQTENLEIKAETPIQVTRTTRGWWNGISETASGTVILGRRVTEFQVASIFPNNGGDIGLVTTIIHGAGFRKGAEVKLVREGETILTEHVAITGRFINATFDLEGRSQGQWDVVVTNPDGRSDILANGFSIEEGRQAEVWVDILGRNAIRVGGEQTFNILFGNRGNIDAVGVPIWISGIPKDALWQITTELTPPLSSNGAKLSVDWQQVPIHFVTEDDQIAIPLLALVVPPGQTGIIQISISPTSQQNFRLKAWANPPFFSSIHELRGEQSFKLNTVDLTSLFNCFKSILAVTADILGFSGSAKCFETVAGEIIGVFQGTLESIASGNVNIGQVALASIVQIGVGGLSIVTDTDCLSLIGVTLSSQIRFIIQVSKIIINVSGFLADLGQAASDCLALFPSISLTEHDVINVRSFDPNEKIGSLGKGEDHYLSGQEPMRYIIFFENLAAATAPAQQVFITDVLDTTNLNPETFSLGPILFGEQGQVVPPPGLTDFTTEVDLRPNIELILRIEARLDNTTGVAKWTFSSLDPETLELTDDPLAGFLPPNVNPPEGEGSVMFTVMPKAELPTGSTIQNQATIVFDTNEPIDTDIWTNTIDNTPPSSQVSSLFWTEDSTGLVVWWEGSDEGSGILDYTIYVSENDSAFSPWLINKAGSQDTVEIDPEKKYAFYSIARDKTGNLETKPEVPDITTDSIGSGIETFELHQNYPNPFNAGTTIRYDLPVASEVKLVIYNILGQRVRTLVEKNQPVGFHLVRWDGMDDLSIRVASGVYLYRLQAGDFVQTRKMLLLR